MFPGGFYGSQANGLLDEVRIWNVARTEAQIAANKEGELSGAQTGLVGYWPMNEGTGLMLHDVSGAGRDVDLTSAGYTSASWTNGRYSVTTSTNGYRYAFNGKEKDQDISEDDYDYGMRIHDARLGRFLSVDPLTRKYSMLTPYQYASNRPIDGIDLDGAEFLPYNKSMYQLEYSHTTTTTTTGGGNQITMAREDVIVKVIYDNIPDRLKDEDKKYFKYVSGGPVTPWGRDWDKSIDGEILYSPKNLYYNNGPDFIGRADGGQDPEPTSSTQGMGGGAINQGRKDLAEGAAGAVQEAGGIISNLYNMKTWNNIGDETNLRKAFYAATNMVDDYMQKKKIGDNSLVNTFGRTQLINFLTDGTLNTNAADNLKDEMRKGMIMSYSGARKNGYENVLKVAWTGLQIMQAQGVPVRSATVASIKNILQKYKANGGGNEYDNITKSMTPTK